MSETIDTSELLRQGIAAAKTGQGGQARGLLLQVIDRDEGNEQAWLWLSSVVESLDDRRLCLENVLAINPNNVYAQAGLRRMEGSLPSPQPYHLVDGTEQRPSLQGEGKTGGGEEIEVEWVPPSPPASLQREEGAQDDAARLVETAQSYLGKMHDVPEAIDLLNQAIEIQPANGQAYLLLGDAYLQQDDVSQAARYYSRASRHAAPDSRTGREARLKLKALQDSVQPRAVPVVVEHAGAVSVADMQQSLQPGLTYGYAGRPGCVSLYAMLATGFGAFALVAGAFVAVAGSSLIAWLGEKGLPFDVGSLDKVFWIVGGACLVAAVINLAIAAGLWRMKNWARLGVVVINVLGTVSIVCPVVVLFVGLSRIFASSLLAGMPTPVWVALLAGVALLCGTTYWFAINRELFD